MKLESNLGSLLGKSSRLLANSLNHALSDIHLTVEQWSLLALLWTEDNQSQKSLQLSLLKDKATINSLVNYLLKDGFIVKSPSTIDKRSFIVSLTQKGKEVKSASIPMAMKSIQLATDKIDKEDLQTTLKVLDQIINNLTKDKR